MDAITADTAAHIEQRYRANKRNSRLGKAVSQAPLFLEDDEAEQEAAAPSPRAPAKKRNGKGKKKAVAFDPDDYYGNIYEGAQDIASDLLPGYGYSEPVLDEETQKKMEAEWKLRGSMALKINRYHKRFAFLVPAGTRKREWTADMPIDSLGGELQRIRMILGSKAADQTVRVGFVQLMKSAEYAVHELGYNPWELDIRGIGKVSESLVFTPDNPFEEELDELAIEYGDWLASGPELRLAISGQPFQFADAITRKA